MHKTTTRQTYTPVSPKKTQMGGLFNTQDREEPWTGGKPNISWIALNYAASQVPIATQLCSNNSKAATAMIKCTKGLYTKETTKFKHDGDLDFFCKMFKKHLQKRTLHNIIPT